MRLPTCGLREKIFCTFLLEEKPSSYTIGRISKTPILFYLFFNIYLFLRERERGREREREKAGEGQRATESEAGSRL